MLNFKDFDLITLLSVDDNEFNQELVIAIFEEYPNIKVLSANDGLEGLEVLDKESVNIILLDLLMPNMDGISMLKELKSSSEYKHIPVIIVTSKEEEKRATYQLGANDFISKPYSPEELKLRVFNHIKILQFSELIYEIHDDSYSEKASSKDNLMQIKQAISIAINSQKKLLEKLGNIVHENNHRDEKASQRMGEYAQLLAKLYGLNSKEIDNIYYSMSIYDIGLLRVPTDKRKDPNSKEFKEYPKLGYSILDDIEETSLIKMAKSIILAHKEHWDGSGYPNGLKEKEIFLCAQIASIVDFYDELTSSRVYSPHIISSSEALEIIKRERGVKFNPKLLDLFIDNFEHFKEIKDRLS